MLEESYKLLKEQDIRITPQRKAILEILYDHRGEHLEIEDIHRMLVAGGGDTSRTGLATVYRAIELFQICAVAAAIVKPVYIDMNFSPWYNGICPLHIWHMPDMLLV